MSACIRQPRACISTSPAALAALPQVLAYDPVGMGVPYATSFTGDKDEALVETSLHALLVLLDYAPLVAGT